MNIPFESKKQYESTKRFVKANEKILKRKQIITVVTSLITLVILACMIFISAVFMIFFLLGLASVFVTFSSVLKVKKDIKEPKELVEKFDTALTYTENFQKQFKYDLSDYFLGNLFEFQVKSIKNITESDLLDELYQLEYRPMIEFYASIDSNISKDEIKKLRNEIFIK